MYWIDSEISLLLRKETSSPRNVDVYRERCCPTTFQNMAKATSIDPIEQLMVVRGEKRCHLV